MDLKRKKEVWSAVWKNENKKAVREDGVPVKILKVLGSLGIEW